MSPSKYVEQFDRVLWQSYAHMYDGLLEVFSYRDMIDQVGDLADCAGRTVFDAGAGTGNVTRGLLRAGARHVISVDASSNMLNHARRKLAVEVAAGQVNIVEGDAIEVMAGLPDASVDRITAVNFLYVLPSRVEFFRQARRVLTPDGFVLASHTTRPGSGPIIREQLRVGGVRSVVRPRLIGIAGIDLVIDLLARGGRYDFAPVHTLAEEAAAQGLTATTSLGRCYGGDQDGVNELLRISTSA
jgi:ubiquinone/menaquinone biosynthesis C-methylase UbiE